MKIKFRNYWKMNNKSGFITFFEILWQFDGYYKGIQIIIFNFLIEIEFKKGKLRC